MTDKVSSGLPEQGLRDDFPRRAQMLKWCEAEHKIADAVRAVEMMGADLRLTDAVCLLGAARARVADFVDGVEGKRTMPRDISTAPEPGVGGGLGGTSQNVPHGAALARPRPALPLDLDALERAFIVYWKDFGTPRHNLTAAIREYLAALPAEPPDTASPMIGSRRGRTDEAGSIPAEASGLPAEHAPPLTTAELAAELAAALDDVLETTTWEGKGASLAPVLLAALKSRVARPALAGRAFQEREKDHEKD